MAIPANLDALLDTAGYKRLGDSVSRPHNDRGLRSVRPQEHSRYFSSSQSFLDSLHCGECSTPLQSDDAFGRCENCI